ncbi:MAG: hypothetical protein GW757_12930 [Alphaproteobacteria bacterium]|nr:hypothetical protein [Alphaproteobacteria bacterium]
MIKTVDEDQINPSDKINAIGISWDISNDDDDGETPDLPENVEVEIPSNWELGDSVADLLSNQYGFCIHSIKALERADA